MTYIHEAYKRKSYQERDFKKNNNFISEDAKETIKDMLCGYGVIID